MSGAPPNGAGGAVPVGAGCPALVAGAGAAYRENGPGTSSTGGGPGLGREESDAGGWWTVKLKRRTDGNGQVFRITGARTGLDEDVRGRQRRYVVSMLIRTLSVILATTLWNVERHVAIVALVLGVLLPYIAVVIANAGRENAPGLPTTFIGAPVRPMLAAPLGNDGSAESVSQDGPRERRRDGAAGEGAAEWAPGAHSGPREPA